MISLGSLIAYCRVHGRVPLCFISMRQKRSCVERVCRQFPGNLSVYHSLRPRPYIPGVRIFRALCHRGLDTDALKSSFNCSGDRENVFAHTIRFAYMFVWQLRPWRFHDPQLVRSASGLCGFVPSYLIFEKELRSVYVISSHIRLLALLTSRLISWYDCRLSIEHY